MPIAKLAAKRSAGQTHHATPLSCAASAGSARTSAKRKATRRKVSLRARVFRSGPYYPDRDSRQHAAPERSDEPRRIAAAQIVGQARSPGTECAAGDANAHHCPEDRPVVTAMEVFGGNGADNRGHAVAEEALRQHHEPEQRGHGCVLKSKKRQIADDEAGLADAPYPLARDPI